MIIIEADRIGEVLSGRLEMLISAADALNLDWPIDGHLPERYREYFVGALPACLHTIRIACRILDQAQ